jgi:2-keto-4-pentenoate hydratase/2-oxohepta-3-ene-1,7-dioic acid hydratase in catechol pathway
MTSAVVRWVRFADDATARVGFGTVDGEGPPGEIAVHEGDLFGGAQPTGERMPAESVRILAPCQPTKVVGLWNNLRGAAEKNGWAAPAEPLYFFKPPSCAVGHEAPVVGAAW